MKILHYALGFPPYRTGGLTKYVIDLMKSQKELGHVVSLLWPGKIQILNSKVNIKKDKNYENIESYEIVNPLPVPLLEGIQDIDSYMKPCDKSVYIKFLNEYNPDVVHVHTLMGIHKEFFLALKELGIKSVFTTHDYFGLCPKVNFLYKDKVCSDMHNCQNCFKCNIGALSSKKIFLLQSHVYKKFKNNKFVVSLKEKYKKNKINSSFNEVENNQKETINEKSVEEYLRLRNYYLDMFLMIDYFHFNSSISKNVYSQFLDNCKGEIISISHRDIRNNKKIKSFKKKLKITYLGPAKVYKGFYLLKSVLDDLYDGNNLELNIFSSAENISDYMNVNGRYNYKELESIFDNTDILVVPSIWYETFGFNTIEALSYGVPVIITDKIGSKDIVKDEEYGYIVKDSYEALKEKFEYILKNRDCLIKFNKNINKNYEVKDFKSHVNEIINLYNMEG